MRRGVADRRLRGEVLVQLIGEGDVLDARSLPQVKMPNVANFTSPDPRPDVP